jgi:hypothetical protein
MKYNITLKENQMSHKEYKIEEHKLTLQDTLENDDYGLIVSKNGELKGIWIPESVSDKDNFPEEIAELCIQTFGLDPNAEDESRHGHTLH